MQFNLKDIFKKNYGDNMSDFFRFEDENIDFPFYNGTPKLGLKDWAALLAGLILELSLITGILYYIPGMEYVPMEVFYILSCLVLLIPVAYVCRNQIGLILKKPKLNDIKVIIICYILYSIFAIAMGLLLTQLGLNPVANSTDLGNSTDVPSIIFMAIQLMGEELFKFTIFIIVMTIAFKFTQNRKASMIAGIIICCVMFGLVHLSAYDGNLIQCLAIIGLGTIISTYPYYKSKNIANSYILHLLIDLIPILFIIIGL